MVSAPRTDLEALFHLKEASRRLSRESFRAVLNSKALVASSRRLIIKARDLCLSRLFRISLRDLETNELEVFDRTYSREEAECVCAEMSSYYGEMFAFSIVSPAPKPPKWFKGEGW